MTRGRRTLGCLAAAVILVGTAGRESAGRSASDRSLGAPIRRTAPAYPLARPFLRFVLKSAKRNRLDPRLVLGVIQVESNFDPRARSRSGARGLMQLMPGTASRFGDLDPTDPRQNIEAGSRYLRYLLDLFGGDVDRALAGYNAGEMAVFSEGGSPLSPAVREFVRDVKAASRQF
jgi:soluble lytic murein transglycosylase-like protein